MRKGAKVAISGTRREVLESLAAEIGGAAVLPCDLANKDSVEALVPDAEKALGQLDILVANAGITKDNLFIALKDEDWDQVLNVNLTSTFRLARAAVKGMMRRRFGRVIGITSVVGVTGNPGQANYTATKAGMIGMFKSIGKEYAKRGVTANCVAPGFHRNADDRQAQRQAARGDFADGAGGATWRRRRCRRGGGLSGLRRGRLCHRPDTARERGHGHDLTIGRGRCNAPPLAGQGFRSMLPEQKPGGENRMGEGDLRSARDRADYPVFHGQARDALSRGR